MRKSERKQEGKEGREGGFLSSNCLAAAAVRNETQNTTNAHGSLLERL